MSQEEDTWEYEYDLDATETFLIDLDLTSLNGGLRSNVPGKRPLDRPDQDGNANTRSSEGNQEVVPIDEDVDATPGNGSIELLDGDFGPATCSMQVLDFHSGNPVVSYQDVVYSCVWSDMIGTNMFFTPQTDYPADLKESVDLLGISRIRLIGHKAKRAAKHDTNAQDFTEKARSATFSMNPHLNAAMKRQACFLEKLMDSKRARGEADLVLTVSPNRYQSSEPKADALLADASKRREEIDKLNRKVVRGDREALATMQHMYNMTGDGGNKWASS